MSLLSPPPGFPPHLAVIWPLIWVQILALRAYVRATFGKGTLYHWSVTPWGRAFIASIDWVPGQSAPVWIEPPLHPNDRIAAALDGRAFTPAYVRLQPLSLGRGMRGDGVAARAERAETSEPLIPNPFSSGRRGLPIPDS